MMSKTAEKAAEREGLITRNWVLGGGAGLLLLLAQSLLAYIISNAAAEIKETNRVLSEVTTTQKVQAVQSDALRERVLSLEAARAEAQKTHSEYEKRLNSLEARAGIHDQWIQAHNH